MPITYIGMIDRWIKWMTAVVTVFVLIIIIIGALASTLGCFQASCKHFRLLNHKRIYSNSSVFLFFFIYLFGPLSHERFIQLIEVCLSFFYRRLELFNKREPAQARYFALRFSSVLIELRK